MRAWAVVSLVAAGCLGPIPPTGPNQPPDIDGPDALARAAACLDRGDDAAAVGHLTKHVQLHPDEVMTRAMLAELLFRLDRFPAARAEYERVVADAQLATGKPNGHLVHCHTRLMQMAEARGDEFEEHLHRGIGLVLLVRTWDADPARRDEGAVEATLGKAIKALRVAKGERPDEPRANLYLADAYRRIGVPSTLRTANRAATAGSTFGMTPAERRDVAFGVD